MADGDNVNNNTSDLQHLDDRAVFRKILTSAKNKMGKNAPIKFEEASTSVEADAEEFERKKQEWQDELDDMSEFLLLKSTEEQKEEGVEKPVDTAFVDEREGMPVLKAVFDVHHFTPEDINLTIEGDELVLEARALDDRDDRVYRKTMIRRIDLPKHVDPKMMHCELSKDGVLTIEMPFHLPPQRRPHGPNVFPILQDTDGRRKIRLAFMVGPEFTNDDITVDNDGRKLLIKASYAEDIGKYATEKKQRDLSREYMLPDFVKVDTVNHVLSPDGKLHIEIILQEEKPFTCEVETEEVDSS